MTAQCESMIAIRRAMIQSSDPRGGGQHDGRAGAEEDVPEEIAPACRSEVGSRIEQISVPSRPSLAKISRLPEHRRELSWTERMAPAVGG